MCKTNPAGSQRKLQTAQALADILCGMLSPDEVRDITTRLAHLSADCIDDASLESATEWAEARAYLLQGWQNWHGEVLSWKK